MPIFTQKNKLHADTGRASTRSKQWWLVARLASVPVCVARRVGAAPAPVLALALGKAVDLGLPPLSVAPGHAGGRERAASRGLRVGDRVVAVDGRPVADAASARAAVEKYIFTALRTFFF